MSAGWWSSCSPSCKWPPRVAVELDREIVRKPEWAHAVVRPGAQVEVVWFVDGG